MTAELEADFDSGSVGRMMRSELGLAEAHLQTRVALVADSADSAEALLE